MKFDESSNFDEQNFDELIVSFIGKVLQGKIGRENFDELLAVRQNSSDFSTVKVLRYTVSCYLIHTYTCYDIYNLSLRRIHDY